MNRREWDIVQKSITEVQKWLNFVCLNARNITSSMIMLFPFRFSTESLCVYSHVFVWDSTKGSHSSMTLNPKCHDGNKFPSHTFRGQYIMHCRIRNKNRKENDSEEGCVLWLQHEFDYDICWRLQCMDEEFLLYFVFQSEHFLLNEIQILLSDPQDQTHEESLW